MTTASVRAAAQHIARTGTITPHQLAAFTALDQSLSDAQRQAFTEAWRADGSPAAAAPESTPGWLPAALKIIKEFEGCHLKAYLCPAGVPTIGWGSTAGVKIGDQISQAHADQLLTDDVAARYQRLVELLPMLREWPGNRVAALASWAYNVGLQAVADSTLRKRLLAGEDPVRVVSDELPRWDKANGKPLAGLTRRRAAEVALFAGQPEPVLTVPAQQVPWDGRPPKAFTPYSPFSHHITPNVTYGELTLQSESRRFLRQHQCDTAVELARFAQKARDQFKRPVVITSGHRPPKINAEVGGASRSEHLFDAPDTGAIDFYVDGMSVYELQRWADKEWPYSLGYGAPKGFIHVGMRPGRPRVRWDY